MFFSNRRRAVQVGTQDTGRGESPLLVGQLYRACESELNAIITYLHHAVSLEHTLPAVSGLLHSIAQDEIEHYKVLCRLLRDLGVPFRLQSRIRDDSPYVGSEPHDALLSLLSDLVEDEEGAADAYRRAAEHAATDAARRLLLQIAEQEGEHRDALLSLRASLARS